MDDSLTTGQIVKYVLVGIVTIAVFVALCVGGMAGCKSYGRYQKRADANNNVKVTTIKVRQAQQEARRVAARDGVIQALADQRVIEARGIRASQDLIAATLTPLYIQHEAIQAQLRSRAEKVYIPVGAQGVPLVANVTDSQTGR